ncbi:MAG: flagellin [Methanoregulaceae archaeon PtaB.Bin009]|nr:MAG: flagellin [Methanoregulaceae archaeon PtaB.Bin009]
MKKFNKEDAFTGLEAAIVLIAFVVVAAVFSYVVLGAGFFTTQKSQEVVHSGVTQASSNIVVKGEVYGIYNETASADGISYIRFNVGLAAGGTPVDMNMTSMTFSTTNEAPYTAAIDDAAFNQSTTMPASGQWSINEIQTDGAYDGTLQYGETFTIYFTPKNPLPSREAFLLEIQPEVGAALGIARTVPPSITNTTLLY